MVRSAELLGFHGRSGSLLCACVWAAQLLILIRVHSCSVPEAGGGLVRLVSDGNIELPFSLLMTFSPFFALCFHVSPNEH